MRIGINTRFLLHNRLEGIGRYTWEVVQRMVNNHPEHIFYFFFDRPYHEDFVKFKNVVPIVVSPPARHPFLWWIWFHFMLPRAIKKHEIDVFFSPDNYLPRLKKIKTVLTVHDLAFEHFPEGIGPIVAWYYKKYVPEYCKTASKILAVSGYTKEDIKLHYQINDSKIEVVYNGVSEKFVSSSQDDNEFVRQKWTQGNPFFVSLGAIHPRKNIVGLLKAFEKYKSLTQSEFKLVLIGRKAWKNEVLEAFFQQMKYKKEVIFTDRLSDEDMVKVISAAHCMVYIPFFEGFGLPIAEAQACGIPVICSNTSSMPEVVGSGGILVDPNDVNDIVNAFSEMSKTEVRDGFVKKAVENVKKFSWDLAARSTYNVINNLHSIK